MISETVALQGVAAGWVGSKVTLHRKIAVQINGEPYYLSMSHQPGMRFGSKGKSTYSLFLSGYLNNVQIGSRIKEVNCTDQALALFLLGNVLGAHPKILEMQPVGCIKQTKIVGPMYDPLLQEFSNFDYSGTDSAVVMNQLCGGAFDCHYFIENGNRVFDACIGPVLQCHSREEYVDLIVDPTRQGVLRPGTLDDIQVVSESDELNFD